MALYRNRYRIESARMPGWDYRLPAAYYTTICTQNRHHYFGHIHNGQMILSNIGSLVLRYWAQIPNFSPAIALDEFVVMPNHVHGIILVHRRGRGRDVALGSENNKNHPMQRLYKSFGSSFMSTISPKSKSLSVVIRTFKSRCARQINTWYPHIHFQWQPRFYDHIIRNEKSLHAIRQYIRENPEHRPIDRNHR
jgi:REP element-mobilizing transposase RayT